MTLKTTWLLAITLISYKVFFGQTPFPYEKTWKRIDSLIQKKGLSKSALEEVNKLYAAAKKEKQEAQWVKAVIYRQQLLGTVDEDINRSRLQGEEEIRLAPPRVSAWLKSLEAEQLYDYLRQNRYRLSDRTEVQNDSSEDMGTWTAGKLNKKIRELYLGSLENETLLQQTGLAGFDVLITKGNSRYLRPTLYDLLANRALTYFQNDDPEQPLAEDAFVMDDPAIFLPGTPFMDHSFRSGGRSGNHLTALNIFQSLERFHSRDARPDARLDATVSRIAFAYRYAVMPEKDSLYFSALRRITDQYPSLPAAAQAWYLQATFYSQNAASFDPLSDSSHQYDYVKAKTICEQVLLQKDSSEGKTNCSTLLNNITRPAFSLETEKVNLPDQPFRILLTYKNVGHLYARIIRVDDATVDALTVRGPDQKFWKKLTHFPVLKTFDQSLPETGDYQQHRVEIRADALPPGQYALFTSSDPSFDDKAVLAAQFFFCSSIAFVNYGQDYFVADRNTGEPLTELEVRSLYRVYDSRQQKYVFRKSKIYKTDQHGYFRLAPDKEDRYLERRLEFYHGKDYLSSIGARVYSYSNTEEEGGKSDDARTYEKKMRKDILFTDRAIYRPGQTIYFKGLLVTRDFLSGRYKIVTGSESRLYLLDANDQRVDSVLVSPDEFGSFHGSFHLPVNLLNGEFRLRDSLTEDSKSFSVEEYKRPKFFVAYDPVKGSYRIGDTIHISGYAKAYAGNALDGSKVSYRVFRETRFPYSWFFRRIPSNAEQEITHGESVTNAGGQFKIDFKANADQNIDKKSGPVFSYRIETDITDLNGETRSAFTSVAASYRSFEIFSPLPSESRIELDSFHQIAVSTRNASGEFLPELLTLSFYRLKTPDRLIRKRYWDQPDQFVMTKEEYISSFPHDEYKNETGKAFWEKGKMVLEKTDSTRSNGLFTLDPESISRAPAGWYLVEFRAKDPNGETVTDKRYIELFRKEERKADYPTYNLVASDDQTGEPGKELTIKTGTSATGIYVIRAKEGLQDSLTDYSFYQLNNEIKSTTLKVEEKDRGGFAVNDVFIKNNRWYSSTHTIHIPWTNKELQVSYETWRNKLLPGSTEEWKVKISGYKRNKVAAEVLTAMYDASLDQFKKQAWSIPDLYPEFSGETSWSGISDFDDQGSMGRPVTEYQKENFYKQYDQRVSSEGRGIMVREEFSPAAPVQAKYSGDFDLSPKKMTIGKEAEPAKQLPEAPNPGEQIRKNFNETAFFFPDLKTDPEGDVSISFTIPEALTQWKWMIFAHTRDLAFGYSEKTVVTQKDLMLQPNLPRFFREGDTMSLPVKISNLSGLAMNGAVSLDWLDAADNSNQNQALQKIARQPFRVEAGQSTVVYFPAVIPKDFGQPVVYRLQAKTNSGKAGDGESGVIPVLSNRILVTETFPLNMAGQDNKEFSWERLLNSRTSPTLQNQSLTVEYTSNPAWYAVQSLPYLMEFPYECAEQSFNRFYANALAARIINHAPVIRAIFEKWKNSDSSALLSNLQKNEELKTVLLRETPWVLEAQNENQQKKNIALLFDVVKMSRELKSAVDKFGQMQSETGGFPWFKGGRDDRYITQYIISGIGHLKKLGAVPANERSVLDKIARAGIAYLDKELKSEYDRRPKKTGPDISAEQIQYLYMRSFFPETGLPGAVFPAMNYYRKQAIQYWPQQNMYLRGMIALFLYRTGDRKTAGDILHSLKENATRSEDQGIYWKSVKPGYYWQESPVETQALLIEAFNEIKPEPDFTDQMKYWLLRQKHTGHWSNTKSTADACYAILLNGTNWLASSPIADIKLGDAVLPPADEKAEAGTGYMKSVIPGKEVQPEMGKIRVTVHHEHNATAAPSWGALYWQYFENLDKIPAAQSPLSVSKSLFIEKNTKNGPVLEPVSAGNILRPGDKLKMRIIIKSDRDMQYVHLKDMRAACLEPVNVLSGYHWQGNLGYYESTKDESSSFFFDYLPRGSFVFEYPLFVTTAGTYSNGITTLECMYAPEFSAHTEGVRIRVENGK